MLTSDSGETGVLTGLFLSSRSAPRCAIISHTFMSILFAPSEHIHQDGCSCALLCTDAPGSSGPAGCELSSSLEGAAAAVAKKESLLVELCMHMVGRSCRCTERG
eukprot:1904905-Alexandrium_andersonii.AAC.1